MASSVRRAGVRPTKRVISRIMCDWSKKAAPNSASNSGRQLRERQQSSRAQSAVFPRESLRRQAEILLGQALDLTRRIGRDFHQIRQVWIQRCAEPAIDLPDEFAMAWIHLLRLARDKIADCECAVAAAHCAVAIGHVQFLADRFDLIAKQFGCRSKPVAALSCVQTGQCSEAKRRQSGADHVERSIDHDRDCSGKRSHDRDLGIRVAVASTEMHIAIAVRKNRQMADRRRLDVADDRFVALEVVQCGDVVAYRSRGRDIIHAYKRLGREFEVGELRIRCPRCRARVSERIHDQRPDRVRLRSLIPDLTQKKGGPDKQSRPFELRNSSHCCSEPFGSQECVRTKSPAIIVCKRQRGRLASFTNRHCRYRQRRTTCDRRSGCCFA